MSKNTDDPFLNLILSDVEIKTEPEEIQEPEEIYPEPQHDEMMLITPFEPLRPPTYPKEDLNIELNNNNKETVKTPTNPQISETDHIQKRAQAIHQREANNQISSFYVNVEPKSTPIISHSTQSPLSVSAYNTVSGFQVSTNNVKQAAVNANPNSHIPLEIQKTARRLGANFDKIISRDPRLQNRAPPQLPPRRETIANDTPLVPFNVSIPPPQPVPRPALISPPVPKVPVVEKKNKEVQTTTNDGTLRFEITTEELLDLSNEKKEILMKFTKAFNIRNSSFDFDSIEERLQHRLANRNFERDRDSRSSSRSSNGYRDLDRPSDRDRDYDRHDRSREPPLKQPRNNHYNR